jgi:hypothetical protein
MRYRAPSLRQVDPEPGAPLRARRRRRRRRRSLAADAGAGAAAGAGAGAPARAASALQVFVRDGVAHEEWAAVLRGLEALAIVASLPAVTAAIEARRLRPPLCSVEPLYI